MMRLLISQEWGSLGGQLVYRASEYSFDFEPKSRAEVARRAGREGTTSILIGTLQIEMGIETGIALFVWGLHPHAAWSRGHLPRITPRAGGVKMLLDEEPAVGISQSLAEVGEWLTTYDPNTGWLCVSSKQERQADEYVEFADNVVAGITDERLLSLWLRPVLFNLDG